MAEGSGPEFRAAVLAAYSVRRRVVRGADGTVSVLWGSLGLKMSYAETEDDRERMPHGRPLDLTSPGLRT